MLYADTFSIHWTINSLNLWGQEVAGRPSRPHAALHILPLLSPSVGSACPFPRHMLRHVRDPRCTGDLPIRVAPGAGVLPAALASWAPAFSPLSAGGDGCSGGPPDRGISSVGQFARQKAFETSGLGELRRGMFPGVQPLPWF